jgi:hypothetical protein
MMPNKIKVHMRIWVNADHSKKLPDWFIHDQEAEVTSEQIMELYNTGYNVMMRHGWAEVGSTTMLAIDYKSFTQR